MAGVDDIDCSTFFDHIDDLLDIPDGTCPNSSSNVQSDFLFGDFKDFPGIWTQSDTFLEPTKSSFTNDHNNLPDDLTVPYQDIAQLEWLSNFVDDSFSAGNTLTIDLPSMVMSPSPIQFQTTSPVSVLESSSSSYAGGKFVPVNQSAASAMPTVGSCCGRARSERRPRPPTFNHQSSSGSFTAAAWSNPSKIRKSDQNTEHKSKKKIKLSVPEEVDHNDDPKHSTPRGDEVRKCQHCEITKTPQWRAGPNGPKTLCNACGVRYKSGRLFPEYRPAASPTFVPSIHSNSHKKVLEMRVKDSHTE